MKKILAALLSILILASVGFSQNPNYAKRIWPVTALPATCTPANGEVAYLSVGAIGVYNCVAANTWATIGTSANGQWLVNQGTLTGSFPFINQTATWNNGAVTFANYFSNVTDTASNAASLLFEQQVGGVDKFTIGKTGNVGVSQGTITASIPSFNQTATWNNAGVTFHNFVLNVTPTAFTAPSYLMELQNSGVDVLLVDTTGKLGVNSYADNQTCASGASPAVCGASTAGMATIANGTAVVVVNTTAVTANSEIQVTQDLSIGANVGRTCTATGLGLVVSARVPGTSFSVRTVTAGNVVADYECFTFMIRN